MSYIPTIWTNRVTDPPNLYNFDDNLDGTATITEAGTVVNAGVPLSAENYNRMERGISAAYLLAAETANITRLLSQALDAQRGVEITATLTGTAAVTLPLPVARNNQSYNVLIELSAANGGQAGDIIITDKMVNGFKVAYNGTAANINLRCVVQGGM